MLRQVVDVEFGGREISSKIYHGLNSTRYLASIIRYLKLRPVYEDRNAVLDQLASESGISSVQLFKRASPFQTSSFRLRR